MACVMRIYCVMMTNALTSTFQSLTRVITLPGLRPAEWHALGRQTWHTGYEMDTFDPRIIRRREKLAEVYN